MKPKKSKDAESEIKTTIRVERSLWNDLKHRALDESSEQNRRVTVEELVSKAIASYVKGAK